MNDTEVFKVFLTFGGVSSGVLALVWTIYFVIERKERKKNQKKRLYNTKIRKEREKAIAKYLKIDCTKFAVFTHIDEKKFKNEMNLSYFGSYENGVWLIETEDDCYEALFKGKTSRIIYVRKLKNSKNGD